VKIQAETAGKRATWTGDIVRTEGEVDRQSRSVYLVAEVSAQSDDGSATLQPGQFARAGIPSREITNLAAIPFSAFLDLERVTIVDEENKLRIRTTEVVFREGETVYISGGPKEGERLCITELSRMIEGDQVEPVKAGSLNAKEQKNLEVEVEP
jgi:multidrug efflux pump subunit AcrA (membrane-fusion protein)